MNGNKLITQDDFDFIIQNRGKLSIRAIGEKIGLAYSSIGRIQLYHFKYGIVDIDEYRNKINIDQNIKYKNKTRSQRTFEKRVKTGIKVYHVAMKKFFYLDTKEFRLECYDNLIRDMNEIKSPKNYSEKVMEPREQEIVLSDYRNRIEKKQKRSYEVSPRWGMMIN